MATMKWKKLIPSSGWQETTPQNTDYPEVPVAP